MSIIDDHALEYKLLKWIDIHKLDWHLLSLNPNAIDLLEQNQNKINWNNFSSNPNAIHLLECGGAAPPHIK